VFLNLSTAYETPPRAYHTLEHVRWGLKRLDEIVPADSELARQVDRNSLRWAMWFHDAVMSFHGDLAMDEERSARLAYQTARKAKLSLEFAGETLRLVLATSPLADNLQPDEAILVDADRSILGASEGDFAVYEDRVRVEWAHADDKVFGAARAVILGRLLAKPRIFHTEHGQRWEKKARENLQRSVQKWSSR
jgi:predicted metal-dependent HD superfamily phosphohydrolase